MLLRSSTRTALALLISIQAFLCNCQSWNATGTKNVTVRLASVDNDQEFGEQIGNGWSVSIGIAQSNATSNSLLTDTIVQQIWTNVTDDPACRAQLFNSTSSTSSDNAVCGVNFVFDGYDQQAIYERMQNDPGDCSSTISQTCRDDLSTAAANFVKNNSMTTPSPLNQLCHAMAYSISHNLPQSCTGQGDVTRLLSGALGLQLLSANKTQRCPSQNALLPKRTVKVTFTPDYLVETTEFDNKSISNFPEQYDYFVTKVSPILLVSYAANSSSYPAVNFINNISTEMICLRPSTIAEGSRTPSSVPDLSPNGASNSWVISTSTLFLAVIVVVGTNFVL